METLTQFILDNWKDLFGGLGTVIVAAVLAFFFTPFGQWLKSLFGKTKPPDPPSGNAAQTAEIVDALVTKYKTELDQRDQTIATLTNTVEALATEQNDPDAPQGISEALASLEQGDTAKAEAIFAEILKTKEAEGQASLKEAAQAAKHIGTLAYLHDTEKALAAYKKASQLDPDDADAWNKLGHLLLRTGDLAGAERAFNKVLALGNITEDRQVIAAATGNLGIAAQIRGNLNQAEDYHQQALTIGTELDSKEDNAASLGNLAFIAKARGNLQQAEDYLSQSLTLNTELGHKEGMARDLGNLGIIALSQDELDLAEDRHQQSLAISTELGRKEGMACQLGNLGNVALRRGDLQRAENYHQQSFAIHTELGHKEGIANQSVNLGIVAALRDNRIEACRLWREALGLYQDIGMPHIVEKIQARLDEAGCDKDAAGAVD